MGHTCEDCDHQFSVDGQNGPHVTPAVQCPNCTSYRTQPTGIPDEQNEMLHGIDAMPGQGQQDDMSGNPLGEGILGKGGGDGGWKPFNKRDESFASVKRADYSLFESPEFDTTSVVAPPGLYDSESAHHAEVQTPKGITDNLHAALGNLGAWVANPYENGQLRPYNNKYWQVIRPEHMTPGSLQIGVADPTMAEIINHVAQTDDLTPLHEYRGRQSHTKQAGPLLDVIPWAASNFGADTAGADAAGAAASDVAGSSASSGAGGIGGIMNGIMGLPSKGLGLVDDVLGGGGSGSPGGGRGQGGMGQMAPTGTPESFYGRVASDEDDMHPNVHDEVPQNEDGDHKQQDDGNNHEWQRDISVDHDGGGALGAPSFDPAGPAMERFMMLLPLIQQFMTTGEDASNDPLIQGLHHTLEGEIPGYRDHGDPDAAHQLLMIISPNGKPEIAPAGEHTAEPEHNDEDHTDENSGGKHEASVTLSFTDHASGDFLPDLDVALPSFRESNATLWAIAEMRQGLPEELQNQISKTQLYEGPDAALALVEQLTGRSAPMAPRQPFDAYSAPALNAMDGVMGHTAAPMPGGPPPGAGGPPPGAGGPPMGGPPPPQAPQSNQGPVTDEQQAWFADWLIAQGRVDEVGKMIANPQLYAKDFAAARGRETPPQDDAGFSAEPPPPAQENAPPSDTMPVPSPQLGPQSMMAALNPGFYTTSGTNANFTITWGHTSSDGVAAKCPDCGSHTTEILTDKGESRCHACGKFFQTKGKVPTMVNQSASTWNVDEDFRKEADSDGLPSATDDPAPGMAPIEGISQEPGHAGGHTWTDRDGNPLQVGQEYEMYSSKFDIPDLVRIEAVKPTSLALTYVGEFGLDHTDELTKEEANLEGTSFFSTTGDGELGTEDMGSLEHNNDDNTGYTGSPEQTDMSAPGGLVSASVRASGVDRENPQLNWLKPTDGFHTAGANYTPMEQRALIDEMGSARNSDRLDLSNTHYIADAEEDQFLFGI